MERYIEMGFERASAAEAVERFGEDLHAGCHWLMMRETMGHVPKRLKASQAEDTYMGSSIRFNGATWTVDAFDHDHALIRIRREDAIPCRWEHMSDSRIEWLTIRHECPSSVVPRAAWRRSIGTLKVTWEGLESMEPRPALSKMLGVYIRFGRPQPGAASPAAWETWRTVVSLTREHVHRPSRPKPRGGYTTDIHDFRVEWMTYFHALCDVHSVLIDRFSNFLYNSPISETAALFPESVRAGLLPKLRMWKSPTEHIQTELKKWRKDCLPVVLFKPVAMDSTSLTLDVMLHDMTFVKPRNYDAGLHTQFQRLFFIMFPKTRPQVASGPVHEHFFSGVLRQSKKRGSEREATTPGPSFVTDLFPFQQRCLNWMIERESSAPPTSSWGWSENTFENGFRFYSSVFGHLSLTAPNTTVRGGLLAQDVGMGKTVEILALVASQKSVPGPTLVVVPTTMLSVWMTETETHVPSLSVHKFHGSRRTRDMDELRAADIVVTTYRIVVNETQKHVPTIGAIRWGRIVLDESHEMRNAHSATAKAVCRLYAPLRWCVSATPWPKGRQNVVSMLAFLGVSPFNDLTSTMFFRGGHCATPALLRDILTTCTWWQQKRHVRLNLPDITSVDVELDHSSPELYEQLVESIRQRIEHDTSIQGVNHLTRRLHYKRWLRLAAIHPLLNRQSHYGFPCAERELQTETKSIDTYISTLGTTNYDESLKDTIQSWAAGNEKCSICMDAMDRPTVTPCHHMFCLECIQSAYHHDQTRRCPLCRAPAGNAILHELSVDEPVVSEKLANVWYMTEQNGNTVEMDASTHESLTGVDSTNGHKIDHVIRVISQDTQKFIVFTQFHNAWKLLCTGLQRANIRYVSIEGRMTPKHREKSIHAFQTDPNVRVFVMTTKTASVGITLTAGSHVLFLEPCLDAHVRKQAIGRAWRIGQRLPVTVTTLKTKGTIDCVTDFETHLSLQNPDASLRV